MPMRTLAVTMLVFTLTGVGLAQKSIRQVDFKNYTYPISGLRLGHDRLEWIDPAQRGHITLVNGEDAERDATDLPGFAFQSVTFADVTGDRSDDAVVVLRYDTGGTQSTDYVYIYSLAGGQPKLLAYCHTGDRAYRGLHKVYGEHGTLVFELFGPRKRTGDCCSTGFIRTRYRWRDGRFEPFANEEYGSFKSEEHP